MELFLEEKELFLNNAAAEGAEDEGCRDFNIVRTRPVKESPRRQHCSRQKSKKVRRGPVLYYLETKYDVVEEVCASFPGWRQTEDPNEDLDFIWTDVAMPAERFSKLKPYQKYNHFVGMSAVSRKNNLGRNLLRMKKHFPEEYKFFPDTWILPTDLADFKSQFTTKRNRTFIVKPDNQCQGRGIFLTRSFEDIPIDFTQGLVAQRYIHKPFLLDGFKFDLRIYVLVTGCDPIRVFIHDEGLVRLATTPYVAPTGKNLAKPTMHLTNYAVNVRNPEFEENTNPDDIHDGHKRSLKVFFDFLKTSTGGHDVGKLQAAIDDLIIKTLIAVQPSVAHIHHSCQPEDYVDNSMWFELLGLDVMIDQKLQPWLLEVNHAPSFGTDSKLDHLVKFKVITDSLRLARISAEARKRFKIAHKQKTQARVLNIRGDADIRRRKSIKFADRAQLIVDAAIARSHWEDNIADLGGFRKLYPTVAAEAKYMRFHDKAVEIWETLTGGSSRKPIRISVPLDLRPGSDKSSESNVDRSNQGVINKRGSIPKVVAPAAAKPRLSRTPATKPPALKLTAAEPGLGIQLDEAAAAAGLGGGSAAIPAGGMSATSAMQTAELSAEARRARRTRDVKTGEYIRVQTNIGWERVLVVRKDEETGKLDIRFEDGEIMGSVIPRIMKSQVALGSPQLILHPPPPRPALGGSKIKNELSALMNVRPLPNLAR